MKKTTLLSIILLCGLSFTFVLTSCGKNDTHESNQNIAFYTCGMHPSVRIQPEDYNEDVLCPICNMKLVPVLKEENTQKQSKSDLRETTRIKIKESQRDLAGILTEPARKLHLFKEIRTVGKIAYDPGLVITQDEYISALKTLDRMTEGVIPEIKERSENLLLSTKRKLLLLGLSNKQIDRLKETRAVQKNLILPEKEMWIYGDVYEYELSWVKVGGKITVNTTSMPGKEYSGIISSINPTVNPKTRAIRFRALINNSDLQLKPEMYVNVMIMSMYKPPHGDPMVVAVPKDAVLDTGTRQVVWVDTGNGTFEGRTVEIGPEATVEIDGRKRKFYPVLKGIKENELVVTKANFLIDSQSQLSGSTAATAYGGTLGDDTKKSAPAQQH